MDEREWPAFPWADLAPHISTSEMPICRARESLISAPPAMTVKAKIGSFFVNHQDPISIQIARNGTATRDAVTSKVWSWLHGLVS